MRTFTRLMFVILFIISTNNSFAQADSHDSIFEFGMGGILGFAEGNTVQFYERGREELFVPSSIPNLLLPNGHRYVFGVETAVGVVINDEITFYQRDRNNNTWSVNPILSFSLPIGYSHIFGHGNLGMGIVFNNEIRFYRWDWESDLSHLSLPSGIRHRLWADWETGSWEAVPYLDFSLPDGYNGIIGLRYGLLGVIVNGIVQFYEFDYGNYSWNIISDFDLPLPDRHGHIFGFIDFFAGLTIGVVDDDGIQFFQRNWEMESWLMISRWRL